MTSVDTILEGLSQEDKQRIVNVLDELKGVDMDEYPNYLRELDNVMIYTITALFRHLGRDRDVPRLFKMLDDEMVRRRDVKIDELLSD